MSRGPNYIIIPGDWQSVEYAINDLCSRIINEDASFTDYVLKDGSRAYTGTGTGFKDEDNMASDSAVATASQQSIKAYVDTGLSDYVPYTGAADDVDLGSHILAAGGLKILEGGATPTKHTIFQGGDQIIDLTYILPTALPVSNKVLQCTDVGVLSWETVTGGTTDHAALSHLAYADSGHTGFQSALTKDSDLKCLIANI